LVIVLAGLSAWELFTRLGLLNPLFFPAPSFLVVSAWNMLLAGDLISQVWATVARTLAGFFLGALGGCLCGLVLGTVSSIRRSLEPLIFAIYTAPKLSLLPILMLFLGIGEAPKVALIASACFLILTFQTADAVRSISQSYVEIATNYGAGRFAVWRAVYLPASLPHLFTGLRLALGRALTIAVAVEMISSGDGLGGMLWWAWQTFTTDQLYIAVFAAAVLGVVFHASLHFLETKLVPWVEENETI